MFLNMKFNIKARLIHKLSFKNFCQEGKDKFCFTEKSLLDEKPKEETTNPQINISNNGEALISDRQVTGYKLLKSKWKDISDLSKFKLCLLNTSVSLSTYAYYSTASHLLTDFLLFSGGTLFISMNTQVLNQITEKHFDGIMKRTNSRPLPKQRISDRTAWVISMTLWSLSTLCYYHTCPSAIVFSNGILLLYNLGYTPLKRISNLSMHIGAVAGALPALLGSFAATGILGLEDALLLAGYIFCWQYPHFYGILYQNREDYKRAGFKFISNDETKTIIAYCQMLVAMIALIYIVYRMHKKEIMNDKVLALFSVFYIINLIPVVKFIKDPTKYSKLIRVKSYTPFMIVILSFLYRAIEKRKSTINI
jgi:protoheme IX farnesyltransferase